MGREIAVNAGELRERTEKRIHEVLTVYPGVGLATLHTSVRPYNSDWRGIFEEMVLSGNILRESVQYKGRIHFRYYTNHPLGEVSVVQFTNTA
jgi:hypothetical protein